MNKLKFQHIAERWAKENDFDILEFVSQESGGEVYYIFDSRLRGKKTGLPRFILITDAGIFESYDWDIKEINRLYSLRLSHKAEGD